MASSSSPSAGKAGDGDGGRGRGRGNRGGRPWERSLVCVLKALRGMEVLVELQNDAVIRGSLDDCDDVMNITITDATMEDVEGNMKTLPLIFIRGSNVRFVHIPDGINVSDAVEEMRLVQDKAAFAYMGRKPGESSSGGSSIK